jgi:1-deoxy-D-xylulose-5-phosphate synthase
MVPGIRIAAPRDEPTLRALLGEAVEVPDGPTVLRFPKTPLGAPVPALRSVGGVDVLAEPDRSGPVDVLVVAVGATAGDVVEAAQAVTRAGYSVRVVGPRWVVPVPDGLTELARAARLVVTVEDGVVSGGIGARISQTFRAAGTDIPTREIGIPVRFLEHGSVADVRAAVGLTVQDIGRRIVEWAALVAPADEAGGAGEDVPAGRRIGETEQD